MPLNPLVKIDAEALQDFCRRWKITELGVFGSALTQDFRPESDVDVLVTFAPDARWRFHDLVRMEQDLEAVFKRKVDLVERVAIEQSRNYLRRRHILGAAERIYAA